jgi:hypothetical protein
MIIVDREIPDDSFRRIKANCQINDEELVYISTDRKFIINYTACRYCDKIIVTNYLTKEAEWSFLEIVKDKYGGRRKITPEEILRYI